MAASKSPARPVVRDILRPFDYARVAAIESEFYKQPWSESDFERFLEQHNCYGLIIEIPRKAVVGYIFYERTKQSIWVHNVAIQKKYQRHGLGRMLMDAAASQIKKNGSQYVEVYVRETQLDTLKFFRATGFLADENSVHREYFEDTGEDAYHLKRTKRTL